MKVSFGQYNFSYPVGMIPTRTQKDIANKIEAELDPDCVEELSLGRNITKLVEEKKMRILK